MSRPLLPLKTRVRYEGLGADDEKLPNHIWFVIGQVLRKKFRNPILARKGKSIKAAKKAATAPRKTIAKIAEAAKVEVTVS
jgi:hypothetical protein